MVEAHERLNTTRSTSPEGAALAWWEVILVFVGIPAAATLLIALAVSVLSTSRVPDGMVAADERQTGPPKAEEEPPDQSADG